MVARRQSQAPGWYAGPMRYAVVLVVWALAGCAPQARGGSGSTPPVVEGQPLTGRPPAGPRTPEETTNDAIYYLMAREPAKALAVLDAQSDPESWDRLELRVVALCALQRGREAQDLAVGRLDGLAEAYRRIRASGEEHRAYPPIWGLSLDEYILEKNQASACGDRVLKAYREAADAI